MRNYHEQSILAYDLAVNVHEGQVDKNGDPYIDHVMRVARAAMSHTPRGAASFHYAQDLGSKLYIIGMLHDTIEDVEGGQEKDRDYVAERIIMEQGTEIYVAVEALTHRAWVSEPYAEYIDRVKGNMLATEVKLEDLKDNYNPERALRLASLQPAQFKRVVEILIPRYIKAYDYLTH